MRTLQDVLTRIRDEYLKIPGTRLTTQQVQRLCGLDRLLCQTVLDSLVDGKFLCVKPDGTYARFSDEILVRMQRRRTSELNRRK